MLEIAFTNKHYYFIKLSTCLITHFISDKTQNCKHEKDNQRLLFLHKFNLGDMLLKLLETSIKHGEKAQTWDMKPYYIHLILLIFLPQITIFSSI